ncbi:unnamed protein product [Arabis nemorensis]|uniref:Uncharacterized protein n=1 Tax=Arabis nemorensis TaxID=586526 RepID=A0A565BK56_9BRAS|nr:unnamed protein product [Arabis nemorensis]
MRSMAVICVRYVSISRDTCFWDCTVLFLDCAHNDLCVVTAKWAYRDRGEVGLLLSQSDQRLNLDDLAGKWESLLYIVKAGAH